MRKEYFKMQIKVNGEMLTFAVELNRRKKLNEKEFANAMERIAKIWMNSNDWMYECAITYQTFNIAPRRIQFFY